MGALKKSEIPKDWFLNVDSPVDQKRITAAIEKRHVTRIEDLPNLVKVSEAAEALRTNPKTVADWMAKKYLKSTKVRGRRFTTPEWINDFLEREEAKNK